MKTNLLKVLLIFSAGIIGLLFLTPYFFDINIGQDTMRRMGMMGSGMMGGGQNQCDRMMGNPAVAGDDMRFSSNGERIFFRGVNSKGEIIKNTHGMQGVGCAMCHGADARGMRMMMEAPDIRWSSLINPEGHVHSSGRKHSAYTEESFKTCVLAGIDPAGNQLSTMMPKWEMSKEDIDDLINYLKSKPR